MNHLKKFNELITESFPYNKCVILPDNIISELKDICLELNDFGLQYVVWSPKKPNDVNHTKIFIGKGNVLSRANIYSSNRYFEYTQEISEIVERIKDYIFELGYKIIIIGDSLFTPKIGHVYNDLEIFFTNKDSTV